MKLPSESADCCRWFVCRTAPGAQMPQREYAVEKWRCPKGYRIIPSLNPNVSAVERSLANNGFAYYMPAERKLVRDRRRTNTWTTRRVPMLPSYIFVRDVWDFQLLENTVGVSEVIRNNGEPFVIDIRDIETLLEIEAEQAAEVERLMTRQKALEEAQAARVTRSAAIKLFPTGSRVEITAGHAVGRLATIVGSDRGARLKAIADGLDALGSISVPVDALMLVA